MANTSDPIAGLSGTCIVTPETLGPFTNGGVGTATYRLAQLLAAAGEEVTLLFTGRVQRGEESHWRRHYYNERKILLVVLDEWVNPDEAEDIAERYPGDPDSRRAVLAHAFLRRRSFRIIYFQEFMGHGLRAIQAHRAGIGYHGATFVTWCHSSLLWSMRGNKRHVADRNELLVEAHERLGTRQCEVVAAPSQYMADWTREHWGIERVKMLPYWYEPAGGGQTKRCRETFAGFDHLVFFGRLERRKGLDLLLGALRTSESLPQQIKRLSFLGRQVPIDGRPSSESIAEALEPLKLDYALVEGLGTDEALIWLQQQPKVLAIAPSALDNFPFVLVELLRNRIPFLTTDVGGIPEVVGESNQSLLMQATVAGVRSKLEEVFATQQLTINYADGYNAELAKQQILSFHQQLRDSAPPLSLRHSPNCDNVAMIVVGASTIEAASRSLFAAPRPVARARVLAAAEAVPEQLQELERTLLAASEAGGWRADGVARAGEAGQAPTFSGPVLFVRGGEVLSEDGFDALFGALTRSGARCACGFVRRHMPEQGGANRFYEHRPVGSAIELSLLEEIAITTPLLLETEAAEQFLRILEERKGRLQTTIAEFCLFLGQTPRSALDPIAIVPVRVATGPEPLRYSQSDHASIVHLYCAYQANLNGELIFPLALAGIRPRQSSGSADDAPPSLAAYRALAEAPEATLKRALDQQQQSATQRIVKRLAPLIDAWERQPPALFVFGAGEHTKVVLALFPSLWKWLEGFIDTYRDSPFLGKPCYKPAAAKSLLKGKTVLYSSKEYEQDMRRLLANINAEHILIYVEERHKP